MQVREATSNKPGQHHKELNPYWKDGGSGLPSVSTSTHSSMEGRSWILRSYKRALELVEKEGKSFEEIAQKQWGSVQKIHSLLKSVGIDPFLPDGPSSCVSSDKSFKSNLDSQAKGTKSSKTLNFLISEGRKSVVDVPLNSGEDTSLTVPEPVMVLHKAVATSNTSSDHVSEAMINSISAKLIKAGLVGNKEKMKSLESELDDLRSRKKIQDSLQKDDKHDNREKTVLLTRKDRFGQVRPAVFPKAGKTSKGKSKQSGRDEYSLASLVEMEHRTTADDTYEAIVKMASKFVRSTSDDVVDDVLDRKIKTNSCKEDVKSKLRALTESRRMEETMDTCKLCLSNSSFKEHLLIAIGINVYLSVPPYQSLAIGHCLIAPLEHLACSLHMDENVWSEVKIFQKGLAKMFSDDNMDVIFTECYTSTTKRSHMYIDCIPIPKDEGSMAPMYFKKAILESDAEWAHNKKLLDTRQKGLRKCVPVGLPYFFVDFNNEGGFAHVIEESSLFPHYFAKEVIGGLIDAEPRLWLKPHNESFEQQREKALRIKDMWKPYNWTEKLKQ